MVLTAGSHFVFGFTQRNKDVGWGQGISFLFVFLSREWRSIVKLKLFRILKSKQIKQPNKSLRCKKSQKLQITLLFVFCVSRRLFITTCLYSFLSFFMPHRYIFFLFFSQSTRSGGTFPDLRFHVLLFRVLLFLQENSRVSWRSGFSWCSGVPAFRVLLFRVSPFLVLLHAWSMCDSPCRWHSVKNAKRC